MGKIEVRFLARKVTAHTNFDSIRMSPELDRSTEETRMPSLRWTTSDPALRGVIQPGTFIVLTVEDDPNQVPNPVAVQQAAARAAAKAAQAGIMPGILSQIGSMGSGDGDDDE